MGNKAIYRNTPGGSSGTCWVIMLPRIINQGFKSTRGSHTLRSFRSLLRSTTASLVAAAVSPAVGAARRLADSMAGAAEKDCFECRVIGTSVCMGSGAAISYELWAGAPRPAAHRYVMAAFAGSFFAMGVYRALM